VQTDSFYSSLLDSHTATLLLLYRPKAKLHYFDLLCGSVVQQVVQLIHTTNRSNGVWSIGTRCHVYVDIQVGRPMPTSYSQHQSILSLFTVQLPNKISQHTLRYLLDS